MKRYFYAGLGALAIAGAGIAAAVSLTPPDEVGTAVVAPVNSGTPSASATPSQAPQANIEPSKAPVDGKPTDTPSEPPRALESITVDEPPLVRSDTDTSPVNSGDSRVHEIAPGVSSVPLAVSQKMVTRADGSIYFVNAETGEEIPETQSDTPSINDSQSAPVSAKPIDAAGAGSKEDKTNVSTAYMNHLNALYNKKWNEACSYLVLPSNVDTAKCASYLEARTGRSPLKSTYTLNNVEPVDVKGDSAYISPLALKNSSGEGTAGMTAKRNASAPNGWLIEDFSLNNI